jgi:hypothetical protein
MEGLRLHSGYTFSQTRDPGLALREFKFRSQKVGKTQLRS